MATDHKLEDHKYCDVFVIGGGPAGSTAATLLSERGFQVVLAEKDRHPRFHIGESLLPANLRLFETLGVDAEMKAIGIEKYGAEFISPRHDQPQLFAFAEAWDKSMPMAYQVRRSEFDEILIRNAERKGATVMEGCRVTDVDLAAPDGPILATRHEDGRSESWHTHFVIDASGRDTLLGNRLGAKHRNPDHSSAAVFGHFTGVRRHAGKAEGNISIFWFDHGWFWFIPLRDGTTSVGATVWPYYLKTRGERDIETFLTDTIALCPALAERMAGARLVSEPQATGNFSYMCDRTHGANYILLGDAFAFIDPVFSSGVMLAMSSAFFGADAVETCLKQPRRAGAALARFDRRVRHGPRQLAWFIYRVTTPTMCDMFMAPSNMLRMKEAFLSMLAGDIYGKTPIWGSILALKAVYYLLNAANPRRALATMRARAAHIAP